MAFWGASLFENDETRSALQEIFDSPNPQAVVLESLAAVRQAQTHLDDEHVAGVLAASGVVDAYLNDTDYGPEQLALEAIPASIGGPELAALRSPLAKALTQVLYTEALEDFFDPSCAAISWEGYQTNIIALAQRLSPEPS